MSLILAGHRWYSPNLMRWTSRDPISFEGGENVYGYVGGDPVMYVDPSGLDPGDRFKDPDSAAKDTLNYIFPKSDNQKLEFGGVLCRASDGKYFCTDPVQGLERIVFIPLSCPANSSVEGWYHTHPKKYFWERPEIFSEGDKDISDNRGIPAYLQYPGGQSKYIPTGKPRDGKVENLK